MRLLDAIRPNVAPLNQRLSLAEAYFSQGGQLGADLGGFTTFSVGGQTYTVPVSTTMPGQKAESIANSFEGYIAGGLMGNSVIFGLAATRMRVFTEARFAFQNFNKGRPADLFATAELALLEHPWTGGATGDLLALMLLHADFAGNCYIIKNNGQLVVLRPDWTDIVYGIRGGGLPEEKIGYNYYYGGKQVNQQPVFFLLDEVAHFAPQPDPLGKFRGMSWLTPVIREIQADTAATGHKLKFFENAATPNLAVSLKEITDPTQFAQFVDKMDDAHKGWQNAYKTLYLGGGADVTVIGANMKDLDFKTTQGAGETRLAQAAGVPPVVAGLAEGLMGSSLNAGNFGQARRLFAETTMAHLWRNVAGSLETLIRPPYTASRLWYDKRDVSFLREDAADLATIQREHAITARQLVEAGWEPDAIITAMLADDLSLLIGKHTGLFSTVLQEPGVGNLKLPATADEPLPPTPALDQGGKPAKPMPAQPAQLMPANGKAKP